MRSFFILTSAIVAIGLSACASPIATSLVPEDTMYFGTNTTFGVQVDKNIAGKSPKVVFGYTRDEKVILPLVAKGNCTKNSSENNNDSDNKYNKNKDCVFAGKRDEGGVVDSYSVLASFGGKFSSANDGSNGGAVAQYFSTGVASQLLAARGGAAVVALGEAAQSAQDSEEGKKAVQALLAPDQINLTQEEIKAITQSKNDKEDAKQKSLHILSCISNEAKGTGFINALNDNSTIAPYVSDFQKASKNADVIRGQKIIFNEMDFTERQTLYNIYKEKC